MHWKKDIWYAFDTVNTVSICWDDDKPLADIRRLCREFERLFSKFRPDSDVWRINHADGRSTSVDPRTAQLIRAAVRFGELSGGAFDVTVGSVNWLWDFKAETPSAPSEEVLKQYADAVDYRDIHIQGNEVQVSPGVQLDLGGIAKGYIADALVARLREYGVTSGLVNLGGNVVALGGRPDGGPWHIGIQDPAQTEGTYCAVLLAQNESVVTSGIYERGFESNGERMHHILDVRTGLPVKNEVAGVTVVSAASVDADALATACLCMGVEAGRAMLQKTEKCEALFVLRGGGQIWIGEPDKYIQL